MAQRSRLGRASETLQMLRQSNCFFLHFLQNLANCAEYVTTLTPRQSKQNVCFKKQVPRWVYCLFASSALLHCTNIASKYSLKRIRCAGALRNTFLIENTTHILKTEMNKLK